MKTKTIISICFLLINFALCNSISSQAKVQKITKIKSIQGATYVLEQAGDERAYIKNNNGVYEQLMKERGEDCEHIYNRDESALALSEKEIIKSVFSDTRIKQLSVSNTNGFAVICICNTAGEVKAVNFLNVQPIITLQEIKKLEDAFLKLKINIYVGCSKTKFIKYNFFIKFNKYL